MKESGEDNRAWQQFVEAKLCAKTRAAKEAPIALEKELRLEDHFHQEVYVSHQCHAQGQGPLHARVL